MVMAARAFFLPGIVCLFCAFFLSLLVSVSLPALPTLDIARSHFTNGSSPHVTTDTVPIKQIRFGIWGYCIYDAQTNQRTCIDLGHGYSVELLSGSGSSNVTIGSGATRGLAVHPVATGVTFVALLFSLSSRVTLALIASLLSFVAALLTIIAFTIDIALYAIVHDRVHRLSNVQVRSVAAPGFWITFASLILLFMAGFIGWFGRRRSRMSAGLSGQAHHAPTSKLGWILMYCYDNENTTVFASVLASVRNFSSGREKCPAFGTGLLYYFFDISTPGQSGLNHPIATIE
ncbi:hypothetical protein BJV74DRAFT_556169 [Russula compacta]|nr:hypothetical protein BJV74DRAFT_556169 [Russula compacta]